MSIRSFIIEYLRYVIMIGGLGILLAAESVMPVVMDEGPAWRHTLRNLAIGAIYVATGTAVGLGVAWAAARTAEHQLGLFYATALPAWSQILLGIVAIDFVEYWRHRLSHSIPMLWRVHRLHHSDPVMEASTTLRNHPLHALVVLVPRAALIPVLGLSPLNLALHASIALAAQYFHHSNISLPARLEAILSSFLVTPDLHFMHHARDREYTDSQYGIIFIWWDKLFGTLAPVPVRKTVGLGLEEFSDAEDQTVAGMLASILERRERKLALRWTEVLRRQHGRRATSIGATSL